MACDGRAVADGSNLIHHKRVIPTKEDFGGAVAANLSAKRAADDSIVAGILTDTSRNIALAPFAGDDPIGGESPLDIAEVSAHKQRV
jgi:hypothetical protein